MLVCELPLASCKQELARAPASRGSGASWQGDGFRAFSTSCYSATRWAELGRFALLTLLPSLENAGDDTDLVSRAPAGLWKSTKQQLEA